MASSSLRRLRHIYSQKPTAFIAPTTEKTSTISQTNREKGTSPPSRSLLHAYLQKPTSTANAADPVETPTPAGKFEIIVDKFKKNSSKKGFRGKHVIYKTTVSRLARAGHSNYVHDILDHQKQFPDIQNENFTARLIRLYGDAKMVDHALHLFDEMPDLKCPRTVISFNALLSACLNSKNFSKVIEVFQQFPAKVSIKPNVISYTTAMEALCKQGMLDEAVSLLDEMEENDVVPNANTFDILFTAFFRAGKFSEGEKLWNLMKEKNVVPDVRCYNSMMNGLVIEKRTSEALELLKTEIVEKGLKANSYSYAVFIKGFVKEGDIEEAKKWYREMVELELEPIYFTFTSLIELACVKNDADFALELCNRAVGLKIWISCKIVQKVINVLVEQSKMDDAKQLVELIRTTSGMYAKVSLPGGEV